MKNLRVGDSLTLSINPSIRYTQYDAFKPIVSVHRRMSEDPAKDVEEMQGVLRELFYRTLLQEIELVNGASSVMGEAGDTEKLAQLCMKELGDDFRKQIKTRIRPREEDAGLFSEKVPVATDAAKAGKPPGPTRRK